MRVTEHIVVDEEVRKFLEKERHYPKEPFNDVLRRLLKMKNKEEKK